MLVFTFISKAKCYFPIPFWYLQRTSLENSYIKESLWSKQKYWLFWISVSLLVPWFTFECSLIKSYVVIGLRNYKDKLPNIPNWKHFLFNSTSWNLKTQIISPITKASSVVNFHSFTHSFHHSCIFPANLMYCVPDTGDAKMNTKALRLQGAHLTWIFTRSHRNPFLL